MLGYAILAFFILAVAIVLYYGSDRTDIHASGKPQGQTMLYSHDSRDTAAEVYYPAIRDSTAPFPLSKREEREKTETFKSGK